MPDITRRTNLFPPVETFGKKGVDAKGTKAHHSDSPASHAKHVGNQPSLPQSSSAHSPQTGRSEGKAKAQLLENMKHTDPQTLLRFVKTNFGESAAKAVIKEFPDIANSGVLLKDEFSGIKQLLQKLPLKQQASMVPQKLSAGTGTPQSHSTARQASVGNRHDTGKPLNNDSAAQSHSTANKSTTQHHSTAKQASVGARHDTGKPLNNGSAAQSHSTANKSTTQYHSTAKHASTGARYDTGKSLNNDTLPAFPSIPGAKGTSDADIAERLAALREGNLPAKINELGQQKTEIEKQIKDITRQLKEIDSKKRAEQTTLDDIEARSEQRQSAGASVESGRLKLPYVPGQYHESTDAELEQRLDNLKADDAKTQLNSLSKEEKTLKKQQQDLNNKLNNLNSEQNKAQEQLNNIREKHAKEFPSGVQQNHSEDIDPDLLNQLPDVPGTSDADITKRLIDLHKNDISKLQAQIKGLNKKEVTFKDEQQNLRKDLSKAVSEKNEAQKQLDSIREKHARDFPAGTQPKQAKSADRIALPYVPGTSDADLDARLTALREDGLPEKIDKLDKRINELEEKIKDLAQQRTKAGAQKRTAERELSDHQDKVARLSSPDNLSEVPKPASTSQDKAANTIKNAFKKHLGELRAKTPNAMGYVEKEYQGDKTQQKGKTFFFHMDPKKPGFTDERVVYRPVTSPENPDEGNFKIVERKDKKFISLRTKQPGTNFKQEAKVNNRDLEGLPTIVAGKVVRDDLMIIPNAGIPVLTKKPDNTPSLLYVPLPAFEKLANHMAVAHQRDTRFLDNKPGNLTYFEEEVKEGQPKKPGEIRLIDVADRMSNTSGHKRFHSDQRTHTVGLLDAWINAPTRAQQLDVLAVCDNYALLVAMIQISAENFNLTQAIEDSVVKQVDSAVGGKYPGAMNPGNRALFMEWIDKHVKPESRDNVVKLLTDPGKFATSPNSRQPLVDMINFNS